MGTSLEESANKDKFHNIVFEAFPENNQTRVRITDVKMLSELEKKHDEFRELQEAGKLSPGSNGNDDGPQGGAKLTEDSDLSGLKEGDASFDFGPPSDESNDPDVKDLESELDGSSDEKSDYVDI